MRKYLEITDSKKQIDILHLTKGQTIFTYTRKNQIFYIVFFSDFRAMITLNKTGAYLWELIQEECAKEVLISKMMERYDVGEEVAGNDVEQFFYTLKQKGLLE